MKNTKYVAAITVALGTALPAYASDATKSLDYQCAQIGQAFKNGTSYDGLKKSELEPLKQMCEERAIRKDRNRRLYDGIKDWQKDLDKKLDDIEKRNNELRPTLIA